MKKHELVDLLSEVIVLGSNQALPSDFAKELRRVIDEERHDDEVDAYLRASGTICPLCGSRAVTGDALQADGGYVVQPITCEKCGATWEDIYELINIYGLTAGESK